MRGLEVRRLFQKEKLEKDVLNRIRWDRILDGRDFTIGYLDRITGRLVEIPYNELAIDGDFFHHGESVIPMHRVREIRCKGEVVWARRRGG